MTEPAGEDFRQKAAQARAAGRPLEARDLLMQALKRDPQDAETYFQLGLLLREMGELESAITALNAARKLAPKNPAVLGNLGIVFQEMGAVEEAEACLQAALGVAPDEVPILRAMAVLQRSLGRPAVAVHFWRRLLRLRPGDPETLNNLSSNPHFEVSKDFCIWLSERFKVRKSAHDKSLLGFALFNAFERLGEPDQAFRWLERGNAAKRESLDYQPAQDAANFDQIKRHFDTAYFETLHGADKPSPIFIVGMPRSGTTLAEQILSSHPAVSAGGELPHVTDLIGETLQVQKGFKAALQDFRPGCAAAKNMADQYLRRTRTELGTAEYLTDKMPLNFRWLGIIKTMFPASPIIHCTRPPLETCMSVFASLFGSEGNRFAYNLEELGEFYIQYTRMMEHWHHVLGDRILQFDLGALKADQEGETRKLLSFCGLEWDDRCLHFNENRRAVKTISAGRVHRPLDTGPDKRTEMFRSYLEPLASKLEAAGIDPVGHWRQPQR